MNGAFEFLWFQDETFREQYADLIKNWQENKADEYQLTMDNFGQSVLNYWKTSPDVRDDFPDLLTEIGERMDTYSKEVVTEVMELGIKRDSVASSQTSVDSG